MMKQLIPVRWSLLSFLACLSPQPRLAVAVVVFHAMMFVAGEANQIQNMGLESSQDCAGLVLRVPHARAPSCPLSLGPRACDGALAPSSAAVG